MISIEAIIRPERIHDVTMALEEAGCHGFYYVNVTGEGRQAGVEVFVGRGGQMIRHHGVPRTLIRTVVPESMQEAVIAAIIKSAVTPDGGAIGDGKIFVTPILDAVRIRTGERGRTAVEG